MQVCSFDYTKSDNKTSKRVLVPFVKPSNAYEGIDITELDTEDQALFVTALEQAQQEYLAKVAELEAEYDVRYRFRKFLLDRISNLKTELI
jgi:hypothetical protein